VEVNIFLNPVSNGFGEFFFLFFVYFNVRAIVGKIRSARYWSKKKQNGGENQDGRQI
jgi:hypothetical protein